MNQRKQTETKVARPVRRVRPQRSDLNDVVLLMPNAKQIHKRETEEDNSSYVRGYN